MDLPVFNRFATHEEVIAHIKARSDDIDKAVIPQFLSMTVEKDVQSYMNVTAGMVLQMSDGGMEIISPAHAEMLLNDGILTRMRIRIELFRGERFP